MSQVGHANSKMTLDVYAQLEQRIKRQHGLRFDALMRTAQKQLHGEAIDSSDDRPGDPRIPRGFEGEGL